MLAHVAENRRITTYTNNDSQDGYFHGAILATVKLELTNARLFFSVFAAMALHSNVAKQQTVKDERAETPAQASSALGRQDFLSMLPPQTTSSTKGPPLVYKTRYPSKSSPSAPGTLGVSPSGVPGMKAPGPSFGGSYTPESVAGFIFFTYRAPAGLLARSVRMCAAVCADRELRTFPRAAFKFVDDFDPPKLDILGGHNGPGWLSNLQRRPMVRVFIQIERATQVL